MMYKTIHSGYSRSFYEPGNFRSFMENVEGVQLKRVSVKEFLRNEVFVYRMSVQNVLVACRFDDLHHQGTIRLIGKKRDIKEAQKRIREGERNYHLSKLEEKDVLAA